MMSRGERKVGVGVRGLLRDLRGLGEEKAPPSLLGAVLSGVGLRDAYCVLPSPIGDMYVAYSGQGVSAVSQADSAAEFEDAYLSRFGRVAHPAKEAPEEIAVGVSRALRGEKAPGLRFDLRGLSEFERAVLAKPLEIPHGEVRPYSWVAREIGRPGAVRAVGSVLGRNPVPLLIPCHRVVRSDGRIGDYVFGSQAKHDVLEVEGVRPAHLEGLARARVRYLGSDTTHIYCYPTCSAARRISDDHKVAFAGEKEATAAGYRPCKLCRPAMAS